MSKNFLANLLKELFPILFGDKKVSIFTRIRLAIAMFFMPKDIKHFMVLILSKLSTDYNKLTSKQKEKISTLVIEFHFRE